MEHRLGVGGKIAYGIGDLGSNFAWTFVSSFALIYYTNVVGIGAAAVGTLILLARILDGFTDILIGNLIDKTRTKMGKARPWLFWSAFPLVVSLILIFNVPAGLFGMGKLVYIFITYTLMSAFFYTASNISYNALVALITDVPKDRVVMGSLRFIFVAVAGIVIATLTMKLVDIFGTGQKGWMMVSLLYGALFLLFTMITVFGVREIDVDGKGSDNEAAVKNTVSLGSSILMLLKNRFFIILLFIYIANYIYAGISAGIGIYYASYVLGDPALLGVLSIATMLPMIIGLVVSPKLTGKFGMQNACIYGMIVSIIGGIIMVLSGNNLPVLLAGLSIRWLGSTPLTASMYALVAESSEYSKIKFGKKIDGMIFSCTSVGIKVGTGLGTAAIGWLLALGRYNGMVEIQPDSAITMISWIYRLAPLLTSAVLIALLMFLNVEKENARLRGQAAR